MPAITAHVQFVERGRDFDSLGRHNEKTPFPRGVQNEERGCLQVWLRGSVGTMGQELSVSATCLIFIVKRVDTRRGSLAKLQRAAGPRVVSSELSIPTPSCLCRIYVFPCRGCMLFSFLICSAPLCMYHFDTIEVDFVINCSSSILSGVHKYIAAIRCPPATTYLQKYV